MPKQDQSMQYRLALFAQAQELGITNLRPTMPNHKIEQLISQVKNEQELIALRKECKKNQISFKEDDTTVDLKKKLAKATSLEMKRQQSKQEERAKKVLIGQAKQIGLKLSDALTLKEMLFEIEVRSRFLKEQAVKQPLIDEAASLGIDLDVVLSVSEMKKTIKARVKELREIEMQEQRELAAKQAAQRKALEESERKKAAAKAQRDAIAKAKKEEAQRIADEKAAVLRAQQEEVARIEAERLAKAEAAALARKQKLEAQRIHRETRKGLLALMKQEGISFHTDELTNVQIEEKINAILEKRQEAVAKAEAKKQALAKARQERAAKIAAEKEAARLEAEKAERIRLAEIARQAELERQEKIRAEKEAARLAVQEMKQKLAQEKLEAKEKALAEVKAMKEQIAKEKEERAKIHAELLAQKIISKESAKIARLEAKEKAKEEAMLAHMEEREQLLYLIGKLEKEIAELLEQIKDADAKEKILIQKQMEEARQIKLEMEREAARQAKAEARKAALEKARQEKAAKIAAEKEAARLAAEKAEQERLAEIARKEELARIAAEKEAARLAELQAKAEARKLARAKALADKKEHEASVREHSYEILMSKFNFQDLNNIAFDMQIDLANVQDEINEMIEKVQSVKPEGKIKDFTMQPETFDFYDEFVAIETNWFEKEQKIASSILIPSEKLGKASDDKIMLKAKELEKAITTLGKETGKVLNSKVLAMNTYLVAAHEYVAYLNDVYKKDVQAQREEELKAREEQRYNAAYAKIVSKAIDPEFKAPAKGIALSELEELVRHSNQDFKNTEFINRPTKEQNRDAKILGITGIKSATRDELDKMIHDARVELEKEEARIAKLKAKQELAARKAQEKEEARLAKLAEEQAKIEAQKNAAQIKEQQRLAVLEARRLAKEEKLRQEQLAKEQAAKEKAEFDDAVKYARSIGMSVAKDITPAKLADSIIKYEEKLRADFYAAMDAEKAAAQFLEQEIVREKEIRDNNQKNIKAIEAEWAAQVKNAQEVYDVTANAQYEREKQVKEVEEKKFNKLLKSLKSAKGGFKKYPYVDKVENEIEETISILEETVVLATAEVVREQIIEKVEKLVEPAVEAIVKKDYELPKILTMNFNEKDSFKKTNKSNKWSPKK